MTDTGQPSEPAANLSAEPERTDGEASENGVRAVLGLWSWARERGLRVRAAHGHLGQALALGFTAWLSTRVGLALITVFSVIIIGPRLKGYPTPSPRTSWINLFLLPWVNWDGGWYMGIAARGYVTSAYSAFFPMFPILIRLVAGPIHQFFAGVAPAISQNPWALAAVVASNLSLLVALVSLALLVLWETDDRRQAASVLLLVLAYPVAFYLSAAYTESTTLALATLTLLFARRGWWFPAGIAGGLAALTHAINVLLAVVIAYEFARQHGWFSIAEWKRARPLRRLTELAVGLGATLLTPAGLALFMAYLWRRFGNPLGFAGAEQMAWGRRTVPPWRTVGLVVHALTTRTGSVQLLTALDAGLLVASLVVIALAARRLPVSFTLYAALLVLAVVVETAPTWPDPLVGNGRYLLTVVPVFLGLGVLLGRRHSAFVGVVSFAFLLQGVLAVVWSLGGFVE